MPHPAYSTQGTASLQWFVANVSMFVPQGVVKGGGTVPADTFIAAGQTCVQGNAAKTSGDPLLVGYPQCFSPLDVETAGE